MSVTILKPIHKPRLGSRLDRKHPLSSGLVSRWLFNECGGAKAWNIANPNNHGALTNMDPTTDWVTTPRGTVLTFDGSDDRVEMARVDLSAYPCSIAVWVTAPSTRAAADMQICSLSSSTSTTNHIGVGMESGHRFFMIARAGSLTASPTFATAQNDNLLHMVVGVGISAVSFILYVDGKQVATSSTNTTAFPTLNRQTVGARRTTTNILHWEGQVHDVAIYNRALSAAEVERMYKQPYANIIQQQYRSRFIAAAAGGFVPYPFSRGARGGIGAPSGGLQ